MTGVRRSSSIPRTDGFRPRGRGRRSSSQPTTTTSQRRPTAPCGSWWAASGCTVQRIAGSPSVVCSGSTPARRSCRFSPRGPLQPEHAALSDAGPRGRLHRDGARGAYRAARWAGPAAGRHPSVGGQLTRPLEANTLVLETTNFTDKTASFGPFTRLPIGTARPQPHRWRRRRLRRTATTTSGMRA